MIGSFKGSTWDPRLNKYTFFSLKRQVIRIGASDLVIGSFKIIRNEEFEQEMILPSDHPWIGFFPLYYLPGRMLFSQVCVKHKRVTYIFFNHSSASF